MKKEDMWVAYLWYLSDKEDCKLEACKNKSGNDVEIEKRELKF